MKKYYEKGCLVKTPSIKIYCRITKRNKYYRKFEELLGIKENYKAISDHITSKEDALRFFLGLFDGDGSIVLRPAIYPFIRITQTNKEFLSFVKNVLESFGIECSLICDGVSGSGKEKWALNILGRSKLEVLKFISENSKHIERKIRAKLSLLAMKLKKDGKVIEAGLLRLKVLRFLENYRKGVRI